ncbi:hypothetical protein [Methylovulum psychrotolerans]|nr:hypothetical protein [Methylovulum psychrotolerans]
MAYPAAFRKKLLSVMKEQGLTIPEAALAWNESTVTRPDKRHRQGGC